ncbi:hypothetical protein SDRG_10050 [Saprolegnia diclina VS20]|uniref:Uncharacterized protein n=1 Tax=Saprolegnia diclina (strain VS20) TaxID=1156394 RepID=T0RIU8_SAPDV|nr:hypothetical protein SDRG_10050 [Saprolegnia diclina VS20]EQC32303.1 hypothetical protein SDRG_10050 [Saprolegnia diclina VS20]|eukprot:XP_008614244.1 hypothetical protein SDRG_10050 [Saprolegnia diclina VS20]
MEPRKIDVAWDGNPEAKENMAAYNNTVVEPKMAMDLASAANTYYMTKPHDDHPWRGKSAFGFATILNRNSCDDMGANGPLSVNLPPLQSYHAASSLVEKAKLTTSSRLSAHKVPHRPMPTPIAPLGEAMIDMSGLQNRSLKLKIKKKHVDISPAYTAQPNGPMLAPTPSNGAPRKLPLAPAPSMDDDDDDSGDDDGENPTGATHNGAALRGGRWTSEEHERFLQGFRLHGHKWKRVQMVVRSRTVTQVRTHAQKYLLKLQKMSGGPETQRSTTANSGAADADGRFLAPSQFGSGATSPTQSMTSGNDDEAAHDKVVMTMHEGGQPGSPRSAVTLQTAQPRKLKTMKKQVAQKRTNKRSDLDGSSLVHIEEAAYTLCALMKEHIDDLEAIVTDHEDDDGMEVDDTESTEDESMDSSSSPVSSAEMKKRYHCRKCRVPKKGHVCPEASSGEDSGAKSLSLKKMSLHESDLDCYEPLEAEWNDLDKYVGYRVARCFGPNLWCRGTIDQVVATGSDQDKIHIVYSEASGRHEWLLKSDAIECIAIEGLNTDDDEAYGVFAGSSLRKRKHWNSLASSLRESPEKDDDFDDDDDAGAAHPAKRLCSP